MIMKGPCWIKLWISELAMINEQYRDDDGKIDFAALGREEYNFRVALITQKFEKSERAREVFELAKAAYETNVERGSKGGRPKKNKRIAAASNSNADDGDITASSSKEGENRTQCGATDRTTDCNPDNNESVDADTRKDSDECTHAGNGGTLKSGTSTDSTVYDQETKSTSTNEARQSHRTATAPLSSGLKSRKKAASHAAKAAVRSLPPTVQEVYDFAEQQKIDKDDARDCFEMCESRQWADKYGEVIGDWKGFIVGFCKSREEKRKSA